MNFVHVHFQFDIIVCDVQISLAKYERERNEYAFGNLFFPNSVRWTYISIL